MFKINREKSGLKLLINITYWTIASGIFSVTCYVTTKAWLWHNEKDAADAQMLSLKAVRDEQIKAIQDGMSGLKQDVQREMGEVKSIQAATNNRLDTIILKLGDRRVSLAPNQGD